MSEGIEVSECDVAKWSSRSWEVGKLRGMRVECRKDRETKGKLRNEEHIFKGLNKENFAL